MSVVEGSQLHEGRVKSEVIGICQRKRVLA